MTLADRLTPKDTEEVRPDVFIQKTRTGKYRQIYPMAWNGKINWKNSLIGSHPYRRIFSFLLILFLAWSYNHDVSGLSKLQERIISDPFGFCYNLTTYYQEHPELLGNKSISIKDGDTRSLQVVP